MLAALCPFTVYARSNALTCEATATVSAAITIATGAISGKVTRLNGTTAIAGATVKAFQGTTVVGAATTNATGDYIVGALGTGAYSVEVSAAGYETGTQAGISVIDGVTTTLNVSLSVPITYLYDDLGRLVAVIDKDGNAATYSYDAVGNLLSISRHVPTQVAIIQFTPGSGSVGSPVTIYGAGFSDTASQNTVAFNGVAGAISASSTNLIVTTVPSGAATGFVTVTSPLGSAISIATFAVITSSPGTPTITGFTPTIGTPGTAVTINGTNFDPVIANDRSTFNIVNSTVTSASATSISTSTPLAGSGHISVTTPNGKATSSADFFIPPSPYIPADVLVTGRIAIGGSTTVSITTGGKIGLILFDGAMGQRVFVNIPSYGFNGNSYVNIYNADGTLLVSKTVSFSGASSIEPVSLPATGTYTIMVAPWTLTTTGSATLALYDVAPDFAASITPGGSSVTAATTTPGQNARLTFSGTAGQIISLRVTGVTMASTSWVSIFNPIGATLLSFTINVSAGGWLDATTLPSTGTYTILVDPNTTNTGSAVLALYNVVHVSGSISAGGAAVPLTINTPGQNGTFTFSGSIGQQLSLNITNVTLGGSIVQIKKPDGTTLISTSFGTSGSFIDSTTLPVSGTYTVLADPSVYHTGNMTLTLYDTADVTGSITLGGPPVAVSIPSPGQSARLTFSAATGQKISINVTGVTITSTALISILKPDGSSMGTWSFGSGGTYVDTQTLPVTGTYTILINPQSTSTGNATIKLNDCTDFTGTISPGGGAVTVTISVQGQNARLTFSGTAGQRVSLNMTGVTIFSSFVWLNKPDGTPLGSSIPITNASSAFMDPRTLPSSGVYTIVVDPIIAYTGNMTLTLYDVPADPTGSVTVGGAGVGVATTTPGQNASLTVSCTSGQQVTVRVTSNTMSTVTVKLLKPDGSTQTSSSSSNASFNLATQTLSVTGTYTISIDPSAANIGSMTITVTSP